MGYLVKGLNYEFNCFDGVKYSWRSTVEAFDWNDRQEYSGGILGIDEISCRMHIGNCFYIIIEYDPADGVVRLLDTYAIKIRKGKVVYLSKRPQNIKKWLERRGYNYRGYGAVIIDNRNYSVEEESEGNLVDYSKRKRHWLGARQR